jgi:hypothetical protein
MGDDVVEVSSMCGARMHGNCTLSYCGCFCHQECARCKAPCQATYDVANLAEPPHLVCATCYVLITKGRPQSRCEGCSATHAYRDPQVGNIYLCAPCHTKYHTDGLGRDTGENDERADGQRG